LWEERKSEEIEKERTRKRITVRSRRKKEERKGK
jgi:hypothetical protein